MRQFWGFLTIVLATRGNNMLVFISSTTISHSSFIMLAGKWSRDAHHWSLDDFAATQICGNAGQLKSLHCTSTDFHGPGSLNHGPSFLGLLLYRQRKSPLALLGKSSLNILWLDEPVKIWKLSSIFCTRLEEKFGLKNEKGRNGSSSSAILVLLCILMWIFFLSL